MAGARKPYVKSPMLRYTISDLRRDFPDDAACLDYLRNRRYPNGIHCPKCDRVTTHHRVASRRSYSCQECGHHVHPTAGTIFHKSSTPLILWWQAIYLMAQTRMGIAAKQLERELGVTYKTAHRMFKLIRQQLDEGIDPFSGPVEVDETYVGGRAKNMHASRRARVITGRGGTDKAPVVGIVERGGKIKTVMLDHASEVNMGTMTPLIAEHVEPGATVYTDEHSAYLPLASAGFDHHSVTHAAKVYVLGDAHTQTVDGFWGIMKPGIRGVYRQVSRKYLPHYVNEYAFRYNHRRDTTPMFQSFLDRAWRQSGHLKAG